MFGKKDGEKERNEMKIERGYIQMP